MAGNNSLFDDKSPEIIGNSTIYITKKSLQFGQQVYQLHNVTGFAASEISKILIPIKVLLALFVVGLLIGSFGNQVVGYLMVGGSILGIVYNVLQPKQYGLAIYLNSGQVKFFTTTDKNSLTKLIASIYEYINSDKQLEPLVYNFVHGNVNGNFIGGHASSSNVNFRN